MCQYSSTEGMANDWHFNHLAARAVGGAGLIIAEATAVVPEGRISPYDAGIWSDAHIEPLARINAFLKQQGAVAGIQLAHAGRKASTLRPWDGTGVVPIEKGGWQTVAPSAVAFGGTLTDVPREATLKDIQAIVQAFKQAAIRSEQAGYEVIEIHAAHGYLLHSFLSPLANQRTDAYGGSFDNRIRLLVEVVQAIREVWAESKPLFVRFSASDWVEGGWTIEDSIALAFRLKGEGVDLIDCSSGGIIPGVKIPVAPNYQVSFAEAIRTHANIATAAVGMITEAHQADTIVRSGQADFVLLAREMLRNPYWALHAAHELGHADTTKVAMQYERAF
jgi:2,4-dienoyl-CoA reductase-like NADH-dependent reductase (Old Yellow Enzyme family)